MKSNKSVSIFPETEGREIGGSLDFFVFRMQYWGQLKTYVAAQGTQIS